MKTVYVLQSLSSPERFYTGIADDVSARLADHNDGRSVHTAKWRPWKIRVSIGFDDEKLAFKFERYLKTGSGRAFAKRHF